MAAIGKSILPFLIGFGGTFASWIVGMGFACLCLATVRFWAGEHLFEGARFALLCELHQILLPKVSLTRLDTLKYPYQPSMAGKGIRVPVWY